MANRWPPGRNAPLPVSWRTCPAASSLTVRELAGFGRYPWHGLLRRFSQKDHEKVAQALSLTDTERLVDSLSGRERQRIWLAMLLAQDSRYLLLDEPTSTLDIAHLVERATSASAWI